MPQLSQIGEIYASQLFWLAIVFALIYVGIGRAMVPRIERTIDDRAARITADLTSAEAARNQAQALQTGYETGLDAARSQAARAVAEAQATAATRMEGQLKAAGADTHARIETAMRRIGDSERQARADIEGAVVDAVQAIVAKLSTVTPDRAEVEARVKAELAHG